VVALMLLQERDCAVCNRQAEWGCHARQSADASWERKAALPLRIDHEEVFRCPRRPIKDDPAFWRRLLFYYGMFKKGHLPDPGAVAEQSARAMQLFGLLEDAVAMCQQELAARDRQAQAKCGLPGGGS